MRAFVPALLSFSLALICAPAAAQEAGDPLEALGEGTRSLQFALPDGGGSFGYWWFTADRKNVGLVLNAHFDRQSQDTPAVDNSVTHLNLSVGPEAKFYTTPHRAVAPFTYLFGQVTMGRTWTDGSVDPWTLGGRVGVGAGVDWFPAERVSIGGHAGLALTYTYNGAGDTSTSSLSLDTATSVLSLAIYF